MLSRVPSRRLCTPPSLRFIPKPQQTPELVKAAVAHDFEELQHVVEPFRKMAIRHAFKNHSPYQVVRYGGSEVYGVYQDYRVRFRMTTVFLYMTFGPLSVGAFLFITEQ